MQEQTAAWIPIVQDPFTILPAGNAARVEIDGRAVAIFNVNQEFFAIDDTCSHAEASLSDGDLDVERCRIECPLHGSQFDLRTGQPLCLPAVEPIAVYETRVVQNQLEVRLSP